MLSMAEPEKKYEICRLSGSDKEFFDFCHSNHLSVGSVLTIKKQYYNNKLTEIEVNSSKLLLSEEWSKVIFVNELIIK